MNCRAPVTVPCGNYAKNWDIGNHCSFAMVTDGLSNTIMLGEKTRDTIDYWALKFHWSTTWSSRIDGVDGPRDSWVFNPNLGCSVIVRPNQGKPGFASSYHSGGAQFALFDGSARFIGETIDGHTMKNLADPRDGNPVGSF
jgi:prepilin-type processing-associated H-X9-DG protein